jgi:hypothetical protein
MHEGMNDFQVWKQHPKELLREAEQHRLAKELRKARKRRGSGRSSALGWEVRRIADRLRKRSRNSRTRDAGMAGSRPRGLVAFRYGRRAARHRGVADARPYRGATDGDPPAIACMFLR